MTDKPDLQIIDQPAPDPFDPEALRLSQDFAALANFKPILATVPVRKPGRQDYFRVRPAEDYRLTTALLELKDERETYLIAPDLRHELFGELVPVTIFTAINRQGVVFLWPCRRFNNFEVRIVRHFTRLSIWICVLGRADLARAASAWPVPDR